jgi:uncharacterized membrane protein YdjX (TVP38/TMEM64 family)
VGLASAQTARLKALILFLIPAIMSKKITLLVLAALLIAAFIALDLGQYLRFEYLQASRDHFAGLFATRPAMMIGAFLLIYITATALSLPGATILTLAGGAVFGLGWGLVLVSFASSIGATLAFLAARFLAREWVQKKFGDQMAAINKGVEKEGAFYLFSLRLVPLIPFFAINLMMGVTPMKTWTFYWVSQLGMLAGTVVYVNAGTQLAQLSSPADILSAPLVASFVLLGLFPLAAKKLLAALSNRFAKKGP